MIKATLRNYFLNAISAVEVIDIFMSRIFLQAYTYDERAIPTVKSKTEEKTMSKLYREGGGGFVDFITISIIEMNSSSCLLTGHAAPCTYYKST